MKTVNVKTSAEYNVLIGENLLENSGKLISETKKANRAAIISDDKVFPLYGEALKKSLVSAGFEVCEYIFKNGEQSKNLATYGDILIFLAENGITRTDIIVALGGGVVGDIAGFCAATYLRGIDFVQIPTTLLAAVDSSVGGKTAVDLPNGKNLVGAFHQPILVICDTKTFDTLDEIQLSCGYAEVIKYGVICDRELFEMLESMNAPDYTELAARCIQIKRDIVQRDEFDRGDRKLLNFGHTLGHAVEKHSMYSLTHGAAVAVGMMMICKISETKNFSEEAIAGRLKNILEKYGLPTEYEISGEELFKAACGDKKVEGTSITAVIPKRIGKCELMKMPVAQFKSLTELV